MNTTHVKMLDFLDTCFEIERVSAEMYRFFADRFLGDRSACLMWRKTARDEENHARQIDLARKAVDSISRVSLASWHKAAATLEGTRQIAGMVRDSPPTLEDAILLALKCEKCMESIQTENARKVDEPVVNRMFEGMIKEDREHVRMLESALCRIREHGEDAGYRMPLSA